MKYILIILISLILLIIPPNNFGIKDTNKVLLSLKKYNKPIKKDTLSIPKQMEYSINKYCKKYNIPHHIVYNIAYLETSYYGPNHINYKHSLTSHCGAEGPMQVMPSTACWINETQEIDTLKLRNNIDFNVETSLKLLFYLKKKYKKWDLVAGYYNTGRPKVNRYAKYVSSNKNYKNKWIK